MYCSVVESEVEGQIFSQISTQYAGLFQQLCLHLTSLTDREVFVSARQVRRFRVLTIWAGVLNSLSSQWSLCPKQTPL